MESSKVIVIFDVDGTINQTEVYAVKAYRKALEEVGKTGFSDKEFIERIGAPFEQDVRYFFGENQSEQVEIFKTLIQKYWIDGMKESAKTFEGTAYDVAGISELAKIPSRDELLSKLLGSLQSPITNFARVIKQIAEQGGEAAPAEAAEETATDAE